MNNLVQTASNYTLPKLVTAAGERASLRFLEFFAATASATTIGVPS